MTNYAAWDKYDAEMDTARLEQEWQIEEVSDDIINTEKRVILSLEEITGKIQQIATALRSKVREEKEKEELHQLAILMSR
jgi:hypothetical protein